MTIPKTAWRIAEASSIGTSHASSGTVCQDSYACEILTDSKDRDVLVIVVSDGAGSAERSDEGSALACRILIEAVKAFVSVGGHAEEIDRAIAVEWLMAVRNAIGARAEAAGAAARDYACTLLAAIIGEDGAVFFQIGDGAIVVPDEEQSWCWVHWPQHGEAINETFFVTGLGAEAQLAFDQCTRRIDEIAVFTDGIESLVLNYATKSAHSPFFEQMIVPVRRSEADGIDKSLSAGLETYLASSIICERTDDDKTLVLATRRPRVVM